jgi:thiol-disulfide isomerase/thioredoxin
MKFIAILLLLIIPARWEPDFETAKKTAKEKNELILLNFSGSDWCVPCILMHRDYLENPVFTQMADNNLILVNADFPRKKKNIPSDEIVKRNEILAEKYNKEGSFPLTLLLTADGKVLKSWRGKPEVSVEQWTQQIKTICDAQK